MNPLPEMVLSQYHEWNELPHANSTITITTQICCHSSSTCDYDYGTKISIFSTITLKQDKDKGTHQSITHSSNFYYTYIRITNYHLFNAILLTFKLSTSSTTTSYINLYLAHATGLHHLAYYRNFKIFYLTHMISILNCVFTIVFYAIR
jgi:hypothetical protein